MGGRHAAIQLGSYGDIVEVLKTCAKQKDLHTGSKVHAFIISNSLLQTNICLGTSLVHLYAKCGALVRAQQVFDSLRIHDVVLYHLLIAGYANHGHDGQALISFELMQSEGLDPNENILACILKVCSSLGALDKAKQIHEEIAREGFLGRGILVGNALVNMYSKSGELENAQKVFNELQAPDVISWNNLIAGYIQHGRNKEALDCFKQMQHDGIVPNEFTLVHILKACTNMGEIHRGKEFHSEIVREGWLGASIFIGNTLLSMYIQFSDLKMAQKVFNELQACNEVTWNMLIACYAQHGYGEEALKCFERMQSEGFTPDSVTYICILKACCTLRAIKKGKEIHEKAVSEGQLAKSILLGNTLVDMYAKWGALEKAKDVFDQLSLRNVSTWNALITGYVQHGHGREAIYCFERMLHDGIKADDVTFLCALKACGQMKAFKKGKQIHAEIVRGKMLEEVASVGNALVEMYVRCGELERAQEVLDELPIHDVVSWTALLMGYAEHGCGEEALSCFECMQHEGHPLDAVTLACILKICGHIGAAEKGKAIHSRSMKDGFLSNDPLVVTSLVDMHAKCGEPQKAYAIFHEIGVRDVVSWTAVISGYAQLGHGDEALGCFEKMLGEGLSPDAITFTVILNACSDSGLVEKGQMYFDSMSREFGIAPTIGHYICIIDLFGRAGHFYRAVAVIKKMPISDCLPLWDVLLSACQKWGNVSLGKVAFQCAMQLDENSSPNYVSMGNIYATAAISEEIHEIEAMRADHNAYLEGDFCSLMDSSMHLVGNKRVLAK